MLETDVPPELARIIAFVNTVDLESGVDGIAGAAALKRWLVEHDLLTETARVTTDHVVRAAVLREALREARQSGRVPAANRELRSLPFHIQFTADGGAEVAPAAAGVDGALTRLVAGVATSVAAGTWPRLK